jgi:hypothetical protein
MSELDMKYDAVKNRPSDINEHIETLYKYATECTSVAELGVRGIVSTWAFLRGLRDSKIKEQAKLRFYAFDIAETDDSEIMRHCFENNIDYTGHFGVSDLAVDISNETYDMVFIDTAHNYVHCYEELCKFAPRTNKYIVLHDTTIDGEKSECVRLGYEPQHYQHLVEMYGSKYTEDDFKKGLLFALGEFIEEHPRWQIWESHDNNNGLTVLKYVHFDGYD